MTSKIRQLASNEREIREAHRHVLFVILNTLPYILGGIALWILAVLSYRYVPRFEGILAFVLLFVSLVPLGIATYRILWWRAESYIVTNQRIVQIEGVITKRTLDSSLGKVNDVELKQSMFGRMFNYGDINILTGSYQAVNDLHGIDQPYEFKKALLLAKEEFENQMRGVSAFRHEEDTARIQHAPAQPNGSSQAQPALNKTEDTARVLAALTELRNSGVITEAEYQEKLRGVMMS